MNKITKEEEIEILDRFLNKYQTINKINLELKIPRSKVKKCLINNNINLKLNYNKQSTQKIFPEMESKILELYDNGLSCYKIAKKYDCTPTLINRVIIKYGKSKTNEDYHDYTLNENYFEKIDTPEKAIILGFLYADGYICEKKHYIKIQLQYRDEHILEQIKKAVSSNKNFYYRVLKGRKYSAVVFNSRKMVSDLVNLGCMQRKSFKIRWPKINHKLLPDFLYGYWLGDGWSSHTYRSNLNNGVMNFCGCLGIASNKKFCYDIIKYLNCELGVNVCYEKSYTNKRCGNVRIKGLSDLKSLINFMFKNHKLIYISRKIEKVRNIQKCYKNKYRPANETLILID